MQHPQVTEGLRWPRRTLPERRDQAASDTEEDHQKDCGAAHERLERRVIGQAGKLGVRRILGIDEDADPVTGLVNVRARDVDDGDGRSRWL
jgi:hypothetical protein